jgi:hypothetical protein
MEARDAFVDQVLFAALERPSAHQQRLLDGVQAHLVALARALLVALALVAPALLGRPDLARRRRR